MGYQNDLKEVLLKGWEGWDSESFRILGKNTTLEDETTGSILVSAEGISVYSIDLDDLHHYDMETVLVEHAKTVKDKEVFEGVLSDKDVQEAVSVFNTYLERDESYK